MPTIYKKRELLDLVADAIKESGWNVTYINLNYPFKIAIYKGEQSYRLKIIIYNITHGGKKRAADEYRIQLKEGRLAPEAGYITLILGYYDALEVFAGFDFQKHIGVPGYSASLQIKEGNLATATLSSFSPYDRGNGEVAVAFRPDFFVGYVENLDELHEFGSSKKDFEVLEEVADNPDAVNDALLNSVTKKRKKALVAVVKKLRDTSFTRRVLTAYGNRCAFSGIQLKMVDAAHIIPVSDDTSTDETFNGVALSPIHHRAYDGGLITFDDRYRVAVNEDRCDHLRDIGFDGGLKAFLAGLRPVINVPPAVADRPHVDYIRTANKLRGWKL